MNKIISTNYWETIEEAPIYEISIKGEVRNSKTGYTLKNRLDKDGYPRVNLRTNDGKIITRFVHRLIAIAFLSNPEKLPVVNHKDENKDNCTVENLEWCTYQYNITYGSRSKKAIETKKKNKTNIYKSSRPVEVYNENKELIKTFPSTSECAREFNVNNSYLLKICKKDLEGLNYFKSIKKYFKFAY